MEEALSNAVYHKSYQIGEPITVTVTPEKIEITSLPGPDRTISDEDIANRKMVSRRYRNRRIGDFLKELHLVEGRNTEIPTILRAMQQNGSDLPIFETDTERTYLTVILPIQEEFLKQDISDQPKTKKNRRSLEETKEGILLLLLERGEMSTSELATCLGYAGRSETLLKAVKELLAEEKIEYTDPEHLKSKNQKLRYKHP